MTQNLNQKTYTLKITRHEMCDLLTACGWLIEEDAGQKWSELHSKIIEQIDQQDEKNGYGIFVQ